MSDQRLPVWPLKIKHMPITTCPKCAYQRQPADRHIHEGVCPGCGIAYQKFLNSQKALQAPKTVPETPPSTDLIFEFTPYVPLFARVKARLLKVPERVDPSALWSRAVILCGLVLWGAYFVLAGIDWEVIGGGEESHDWGNLLTMMNALPHTQAVARCSFAIGTVLMLLGVAWGAYILRLQQKTLALNRAPDS